MKANFVLDIDPLSKELDRRGLKNLIHDLAHLQYDGPLHSEKHHIEAIITFVTDVSESLRIGADGGRAVLLDLEGIILEALEGVVYVSMSQVKFVQSSNRVGTEARIEVRLAA